MNDTRSLPRLLFCAGGLFVVLAAMGTRLAFLHLGPHEEIRAKVDESRAMEVQIPVERGRISDRSGRDNVLALDLAVRDVCADPKVICTNNLVQPVSLRLAQALNLPADQIAARLDRPARRYALIQPAVNMDVVEAIRAQKLEGVFFNENRVRYYPQGDFLCHVLGFVNREGQGSLGIEQRMDRYLRGTPGMVEGEKDAGRREIRSRRRQYIPPIEGADLTLTIDQYIQHIVESALDGAMAAHRAKGAWAIVQRVRTGEILAMASRPAFDLNQFRTATDQQKLNRAVGFVYEPGSTFKAIVFAACLEQGLVTPDTVFDCENGAWMHRGKVLRDYHPYGRLNVADGIKKSSNIMSAKLSILLGDQKLYDYMRAFGVGSATGIELPGEELGLLRPLKGWSGISGSRMAIGQGIGVTALQMLQIYSAIANDGVLMRPYVVSRAEDRKGNVLFEQSPEEIGRPLKPETAQVMRRLLRRVVEEGGTGRKAALSGYSVAGKTGTAQKAVAGGYSSTDYVASFVGFVPAERPEFTLIVVVDEPQPLHTGGVVAAPCFSRIATGIVRYLGVPPDEVPGPGVTLARR